MNEEVIKAVLDAIDRIVERTENTWDNAAAIVLRFLAQEYLGVKMGDGCPDDCQAECDRLKSDLEAIPSS